MCVCMHDPLSEKIGLGLTRSRYFVMLFVHGHACFLQLQTHFVANVLQRVHRRDWEIAFLCPNLVTEIWKLLSSAVPMSLDAIVKVLRRVPAIRKLHIVEDEKFRFRPEE